LHDKLSGLNALVVDILDLYFLKMKVKEVLGKTLISKAVYLRDDEIALPLKYIVEGIKACISAELRIVAIDLSFKWPNREFYYQPMWGDFLDLDAPTEKYLQLFGGVDFSKPIDIDLCLEFAKRFDLLPLVDYSSAASVQEFKAQIVSELNGVDQQSMFFVLYLERRI
jgi:hypothetical protein